MEAVGLELLLLHAVVTVRQVWRHLQERAQPFRQTPLLLVQLLTVKVLTVLDIVRHCVDPNESTITLQRVAVALLWVPNVIFRTAVVHATRK